MKLLLLDNYDSFTYNLLHLAEQFEGVEVTVRRNDAIGLNAVNDFDKILLSPGPGLPAEAGILKPLIREYAESKSILGVCLGMQAIAEVFGGRLFNLEHVQHGVATDTQVTEKNEILFRNIPGTFKTGRYHSWMVDKQTLPACLHVTSIDEKGNIMSLRHAQYDVCGVQFHPESILTAYGKEMMRNWLGSGRSLR